MVTLTRLGFGSFKRDRRFRATMKGVLTGQWIARDAPYVTLVFTLTQTGTSIAGSAHACGPPRLCCCPYLPVTGTFHSPRMDLAFKGGGFATFVGRLDGDSMIVGRFGHLSVTLKKRAERPQYSMAERVPW